MQRALFQRLISRLPYFSCSCRFISGEEYHQVDWTTAALKYLRYVGVDIQNSIRLYKRLGKTKYFTRDNVANLVEFFDQIGLRGSAIKNSIICAPDLLRVPLETLEARGCWFRYSFGLTQQQLRDVLELYPNLLEDKGTERFEEAVLYFQELGINREEFREMMLKSPSFLQRPIEESISKTIGFFLDRDVHKSDIIEAIMKFPELLQYSLIGHILPKAHYFETELNISEKKFAQVFIKHGWVLGLNLDGDIRHTVQWLMDCGASKSTLGQIITKFPEIFGYSVENNFKPKLDYLVHYLGMPFGELAKIIDKCPGFMASSLRDNIRPFVWCLEHELAMSMDNIQQVFMNAPVLLGLSYADVIRPTIQYFLEDLGCERDQFAQMLNRFPQLLCYSLEENIQPRVQWLRKTIGMSDEKIKTAALHRIYEHKISSLNNKLTFIKSQLDITHEELCSMVIADTSILHKSLANLAKKIAYLEVALKKSRTDLVAMPRFLGYSFNSRIRARLEFLQSIHENPTTLTLDQLYSASDEDFAAAYSKGSYLKFQKRLLKEAANEEEDDAAEEKMLEDTFFQENDLVPIEEIREAERRFTTHYKYQTVLE